MRAIAIVLAFVLATAPVGVASADDGGTTYRRTTPRAALTTVGGALVIGVPGGRAWGVESELRPLPGGDAVVVVRLAVSDPGVREAFVRVAYYAAATGRTRQLGITDSAPVPAGSRALVAVALDPPRGAVAYRIRVLARLTDPAGRSSDDAIVASLHAGHGAPDGAWPLASRLLP